MGFVFMQVKYQEHTVTQLLMAVNTDVCSLVFAIHYFALIHPSQSKLWFSDVQAFSYCNRDLLFMDTLVPDECVLYYLVYKPVYKNQAQIKYKYADWSARVKIRIREENLQAGKEHWSGVNQL